MSILALGLEGGERTALFFGLDRARQHDAEEGRGLRRGEGGHEGGAEGARASEAGHGGRAVPVVFTLDNKPQVKRRWPDDQGRTKARGDIAERGGSRDERHIRFVSPGGLERQGSPRRQAPGLDVLRRVRQAPQARQGKSAATAKLQAMHQ